MDTIESHRKIWDSLKRKDLETVIENHICERRPFLNVLIRHAKSMQKKDGNLKILEVGCGIAIDSYYLANAIDGCDVYAVDITDEAINIANTTGRQFDKKIRLFKQDALAMGFPDRAFDMVFSQGFVEHFKDPVPVLKESLRILKDDGLLAISVPHRYSLFTIFKRIKMFLGKWQHGWEIEYTVKDFRKLAALLDLEILEYDGYGSFFIDILSKFIPINRPNAKKPKIGLPYFSKNIFAVLKKKLI